MSLLFLSEVSHFRNTVAKFKKNANPTKDSYDLLSVSLILNILNSMWIFVCLCLAYFIYYNVIQIHSSPKSFDFLIVCAHYLPFSSILLLSDLNFLLFFWILWMLWQWIRKCKHMLKASILHHSCDSYEQDLRSKSSSLGVVIDNIFSLLKSYTFYFYYSGIFVIDIKE